MSEAEEIVGRQLDAYDAREIDAFMACWADDARYYEHPDKLLANGAAEIRARHVGRFKKPSLFGRLIQRRAVGNKVVDREIVTRTFPGRRRTCRRDRNLRGRRPQDRECVVRPGHARARHAVNGPVTSLWAPTQSAAFDRGRQLTRDCRTYVVAGVRPLA